MSFDYMDMACCTECGNVRSHNEDAVAVDKELGCCILADGMGGTEAGEVASTRLVSRVEQCLKGMQKATPEERCSAVDQEIFAVDQWLQKFSAEKGFRNGCGTTVVVFLGDPWQHDRAVALSIGDSRLYRYRNDVLERITVDHTIAAESGISESSLPRIYQGMLTRAVGFGLQAAADRFDLQMQSGDIYFLCSDGLNKVFDDQQLKGLVKFLRNHSAENMARILVSCVLDCGAPDNVSVAVVQVGKIPESVSEPSPEVLEHENLLRQSRKGSIVRK